MTDVPMYNVEGLTILAAMVACRREAEVCRQEGLVVTAARLDQTADAVAPLLYGCRLSWWRRALIRWRLAVAQPSAPLCPHGWPLEHGWQKACRSC